MMEKQFYEENNVNNQSSDSTENYVYKNVIKNNKDRRTFSVMALIMAILSLGFFWVPWVSFGLSGVSVILSLISRKKLSYFDFMSLWGIIISIFAIVFSATAVILTNIFNTL